MSSQWDRFSKRNRELVQEDLGFSDNVEVFTPSESYTAGDGFTTSYSSEGLYDWELSQPSSMPDQDAGGTTVSADMIAHAPDDILTNLPNGLTEYGESGEAPARVEAQDSNIMYEVSTFDNERNGVLRVELVEVDER